MQVKTEPVRQQNRRSLPKQRMLSREQLMGIQSLSSVADQVQNQGHWETGADELYSTVLPDIEPVDTFYDFSSPLFAFLLAEPFIHDNFACEPFQMAREWIRILHDQSPDLVSIIEDEVSMGLTIANTLQSIRDLVLSDSEYEQELGNFGFFHFSQHSHGVYDSIRVQIEEFVRKENVASRSFYVFGGNNIHVISFYCTPDYILRINTGYGNDEQVLRLFESDVDSLIHLLLGVCVCVNSNNIPVSWEDTKLWQESMLKPLAWRQASVWDKELVRTHECKWFSFPKGGQPQFQQQFSGSCSVMSLLCFTWFKFILHMTTQESESEQEQELELDQWIDHVRNRVFLQMLHDYQTRAMPEQPKYILKEMLDLSIDLSDPTIANTSRSPLITEPQLEFAYRIPQHLWEPVRELLCRDTAQGKVVPRPLGYSSIQTKEIHKKLFSLGVPEDTGSTLRFAKACEIMNHLCFQVLSAEYDILSVRLLLLVVTRYVISIDGPRSIHLKDDHETAWRIWCMWRHYEVIVNRVIHNHDLEPDVFHTIQDEFVLIPMILIDWMCKLYMLFSTTTKCCPPTRQVTQEHDDIGSSLKTFFDIFQPTLIPASQYRALKDRIIMCKLFFQDFKPSSSLPDANGFFSSHFSCAGIKGCKSIQDSPHENMYGTPYSLRCTVFQNQHLYHLTAMVTSFHPFPAHIPNVDFVPIEVDLSDEQPTIHFVSHERPIDFNYPTDFWEWEAPFDLVEGLVNASMVEDDLLTPNSMVRRAFPMRTRTWSNISATKKNHLGSSFITERTMDRLQHLGHLRSLRGASMKKKITAMLCTWGVSFHPNAIHLFHEALLFDIDGQADTSSSSPSQRFERFERFLLGMWRLAMLIQQRIQKQAQSNVASSSSSDPDTQKVSESLHVTRWRLQWKQLLVDTVKPVRAILDEHQVLAHHAVYAQNTEDYDIGLLISMVWNAFTELATRHVLEHAVDDIWNVLKGEHQRPGKIQLSHADHPWLSKLAFETDEKQVVCIDNRALTLQNGNSLMYASIGHPFHAFHVSKQFYNEMETPVDLDIFHACNLFYTVLTSETENRIVFHDIKHPFWDKVFAEIHIRQDGTFLRYQGRELPIVASSNSRYFDRWVNNIFTCACFLVLDGPSHSVFLHQQYNGTCLLNSTQVMIAHPFSQYHLDTYTCLFPIVPGPTKSDLLVYTFHCHLNNKVHHIASLYNDCLVYQAMQLSAYREHEIDCIDPWFDIWNSVKSLNTPSPLLYSRDIATYLRKPADCKMLSEWAELWLLRDRITYTVRLTMDEETAQTWSKQQRRSLQKRNVRHVFNTDLTNEMLGDLNVIIDKLSWRLNRIADQCDEYLWRHKTSPMITDSAWWVLKWNMMVTSNLRQSACAVLAYMQEATLPGGRVDNVTLDRLMEQWDVSKWYMSNRKLYDVMTELCVCHVMREQQHQLITTLEREIFSDRPHPIHQAIMGSGKSSMIIPALVLRCIAKQQNVCVVQPAHLVSAAAKRVQNVIWRAFPCRFVIVDFQFQVNIEQIKKGPLTWLSGPTLQTQMIQIMSDVQTKEDFLKMKLKNADKQVDAVMILDEVDTMSDPMTSELNIPELGEVIFHPLQQDEWLFKDRYCALIAHLASSTFDPSLVNHDTAEQLWDLLQPLIPEDLFPKFRDKILNDLSGCASAAYNLEYGPSRKRFAVVPYRGVDSPDEDSTFSDPDVAAVLTCFMYLKHGIYTKEWLEMMDDWKTDVDLPLPFRDYCISVLYDSTPASMAANKTAMDIFQHYRMERRVPERWQEPDVITVFLQYEKLPKFEMHKHRNNINFYDIMTHMTKHQVAISGTVDMHVPLNSCYTGVRPQEGANEIMEAHIKGLHRKNHVFYLDPLPGEPKKNPQPAQPELRLMHRLFSRLIRIGLGSSPSELRYQALIDSGAFLKYTSAPDVATLLHRLFNQKYGLSVSVVYFNDQGNPITLPGVPHPRQSTQQFLYYDQKHTIGSDLPQHTLMKGLVTVSVHNRMTDLVQAIYRLRLLGRGHSVDFVVSEDVMKQMQRLTGKLDRSRLNANDLSLFLKQNHIAYQNRSHTAFAIQNIRSIQRAEDHSAYRIETLYLKVEEFLQHFPDVTQTFDVSSSNWAREQNQEQQLQQEIDRHRREWKIPYLMPEPIWRTHQNVVEQLAADYPDHPLAKWQLPFRISPRIAYALTRHRAQPFPIFQLWTEIEHGTVMLPQETIGPNIRPLQNKIAQYISGEKHDFVTSLGILRDLIPFVATEDAFSFWRQFVHRWHHFVLGRTPFLFYGCFSILETYTSLVSALEQPILPFHIWKFPSLQDVPQNELCTRIWTQLRTILRQVRDAEVQSQVQAQMQVQALQDSSTEDSATDDSAT